MVIAAFGLAVELALALPELDPLPGVPERLLPDGPPVRVELAPVDELEAAWTGPQTPPQVAHASVDGARWEAARGREGDLRMDHALARFHLDRTATRLLCAPADRDNPGWRRLLLDTALVTASLVRGHDALHAGTVVLDGRALAVVGASGAGKTTLTLELLRRGARFLADDVTALKAGREDVVALPGPAVANFPATDPVSDLADPLHRFADEWWVRVREPHLAPAPVRVVVVLEREPAPMTRLRDTGPTLLQHALQSGTTAERRAARFELLACLSQQVEVIRLGVDRSRPVGELVEELLEALGR
jgi:hypothetical protein